MWRRLQSFRRNLKVFRRNKLICFLKHFFSSSQPIKSNTCLKSAYQPIKINTGWNRRLFMKIICLAKTLAANCSESYKNKIVLNIFFYLFKVYRNFWTCAIEHKRKVKLFYDRLSSCYFLWMEEWTRRKCTCAWNCAINNLP